VQVEAILTRLIKTNQLINLHLVKQLIKMFFLHLEYQILSTNHGGKSTELQGWVKIMMKDQNPNFGHFF